VYVFFGADFNDRGRHVAEPAQQPSLNAQGRRNDYYTFMLGWALCTEKFI